MNKQNIDKYINEHLDDFSIMKTSDFMLQCFNDLGLSNEWVSRDSSKPCPEGVCEFNAYNKHVSALRRENAELIKELADLKASLPKVRADAVREAIKSLEHDCNGWAKDDQGRVYWHDKQILRVADEMEEGNE